MNVNCAKFQRKFDSRTISREFPYVVCITAMINHFFIFSAVQMYDISYIHLQTMEMKTNNTKNADYNFCGLFVVVNDLLFIYLSMY